MKNSIFVISPYKYRGQWVFDDPDAGLEREPFVCGIPEMIDHFTREIPKASSGFVLMFSDLRFPSANIHLRWLKGNVLDNPQREEFGNWYRCDDPPMEGWLCPALFRYFDQAPRNIYAQAFPISSH